MEENHEKYKGTVQYWLEVHRIGSLLFENIKNGDNALKSLTTSIIETPLLSDIECLSVNDPNKTIRSPFTAWLLEGLMKASTSNTLAHLKTFYTVSQSKLLISCFERDLFAFEKLISCYVEFLEEIIKIEAFPSELKFLLKSDFTLVDYNKTLTATIYIVKNSSEQLDFIVILIEVIKSVLNLINCYCEDVQFSLCKILLVMISMDIKGINYSVLPLLGEILNPRNTKSLPDNVVDSTFKMILNMILNSDFSQNFIYQQNVCQIWSSLKKNNLISIVSSKNIIKKILSSKILKNKKCSVLKNFLMSELSLILKETNYGNNTFEYLNEFPTVSFIDKIYLSFDSILNELEEVIIQDHQLHKSTKFCHTQVYAAKASSTWNTILSFINVLLGNGDLNAAKSRLENFCDIIKLSWKILCKLQCTSPKLICKFEIIFFSNLYHRILEKILSDLNIVTHQKEATLEMVLESLSCLLNFPEAQNQEPELCRSSIEFLINPLKLEKFQLPGFKNPTINSNVHVLLLQCMQTLPLGASAETCLSIFSKCSLQGNHNKDLAIQAIKGVPFLFLSSRISPSRLISDILLPVAQQDSIELLEVLIDVLVDLVCALAGTACIKRDNNFGLSIYCSKCFSENFMTRSEEDLTLVEPHLTSLLCKISLEDVHIKRKLLQSVPRLTLHMKLFLNSTILEKCLPFLCDKNEEIRLLFSNNIINLVFGTQGFQKNCAQNGSMAQNTKDFSDALKALNMIILKLEEYIHLSLNFKEHAFLQNTLLEALINIGCVPISSILCKAIRLLLLFIGQSNVSLSAIFLEITSAHKTTPLLLYYSYRPEISHFLGNLVAVNRIQYKQSLRSSFLEVITILKGLSEPRLVAGSENYIVPVLILWALRHPGAGDLLEEWSTFAEQPTPSVLTRCFHATFTYIFLNESLETFDKCMSLIEKLTDVKLPELITHSQKLIINQLLFNYHKAPRKVINGLKKVIGLSADCGKEDVADSLEPRFVGYLLFIVSKFVKEINADSEKIQAIQSLASVIELMGRKYVTPVARKIVATLQTTLTTTFNEEYLSVLVNAWDVFVQTIKIEKAGPLLATIVVSLLPFLDHLPVAVSRIFNYLIVKNEEAVKEFLPSLIFIPDHSLLDQVNSRLKKYTSFENESVRDKLIRETSLAFHETVGVRVEGLKAIQVSLRKFWKEIQDLIIGSDEPDSCVKTLLESLVICCSDPDDNIATLAASCLGQLGAVDPGLLPRKPKPKNTLPLSVHDTEFAFLALTKISRGFQNARNSVDMDAFAIAIQELLKIYQIGPTAENEIWNRFPTQTQSLMTPMLSSWFKVQAPKRDVWPEVVFGSKGTNTHIGWASLWASKLINCCKDERAVFLFKACEPSLKRDTKVLLFFLQYILLQAIIKDSSVHDEVIKEMEAVINYNALNVEYDDFKIKARPIRLIDYCGYPKMRSKITESEAKNCAMTVFLLIDFLQSWLRIYRSVLCSPNGDHLLKRDYLIVNDFLEKIDYFKLSMSNYEMGEYPRAIMYLEDVILKTNSLSEHLPLLSKAYALYGDLDSVAGSSTFQKTAPKIQDLLLSHQVSGQLEEVRIIYEKLGKDEVLTPSHTQEFIQCYLKLGEPYTALNYINSFTKDQPDLMSILSEEMTECLLKLGDYSQLDEFLTTNKFVNNADWFVQVGRIIVDVLKNKKNDVLIGLSSARLDLANSLSQVGLRFSDYHQGYFCLIKLQILNEIERVFDILYDSSTSQSDNIKQLVEEWNSRSSIVQSDHSSLECLLSMRRVLLKIIKDQLVLDNYKFIEDEIAKTWIKSAEIARKAGCFHQAYNFILNAENYNIPLTFIEKAQLYWDKNDQDLCLLTLSRGIKEFFPNASEMKNWPAGERLEERKMCADAKLLYAIYNEETSNCDHNTNMINYQSAFEVCRQLEKTEAFLGQCLDRVVQHIENNEHEQRKVCELKVLMVHHFGKSLLYGCEYIYQTVPRMLSIWLDLGEKVDTDDKADALFKINKIIQGFLDTLPAFVFMTALPQLLSRLGHPNRKVFLLLKNILGLLVASFPQQSLWAVQAVAKSSVSERVQRYTEFIQDSAARSTELCKLIGDFTNLCDKLNKLTNRNLSQEAAFCGLKVSSIVRELPQLLSSEKFSAIIIPITRFCSISLPRNVVSSSHEPFPKHAVYITGIEEEVTVLQSLQRPRKISFRGSDGNLYDILCKPKDDLRRDGRLMEFNNIVNMYLHRDPDSRLRRLHIRTYVVTPLGENGGLLEWVPNLIGLRQILIKIYKQFGKYMKMKEIKRNECLAKDALEKKRKIFVEKLLPLHPPLLPEWFRLTFPDPSGWYIARESYVRTTAVISMVGYILGLGDRHGENILFDSQCGDTVHVDFNCLFNKGEKFEWKERVPFRLTHNMVAAMGPFGVEGTFRKSCEISLRVLRSQAKTLMSVLTPFAYDPFGSWGKNKEIEQNERDQKIGEAFSELTDIEKRLNGSLRVKQKQSSVYLSVEGQVRSLILEATNIDNLCQMYFGWGAYL